MTKSKKNSLVFESDYFFLEIIFPESVLPFSPKRGNFCRQFFSFLLNFRSYLCQEAFLPVFNVESIHKTLLAQYSIKSYLINFFMLIAATLHFQILQINSLFLIQIQYQSSKQNKQTNKQKTIFEKT